VIVCRLKAYVLECRSTQGAYDPNKFARFRDEGGGQQAAEGGGPPHGLLHHTPVHAALLRLTCCRFRAHMHLREAGRFFKADQAHRKAIDSNTQLIGRHADHFAIPITLRGADAAGEVNDAEGAGAELDTADTHGSGEADAV
jgi:hypothetical protein